MTQSLLCSLCGTNETYILPKNNIPYWCRHPETKERLCRKCFNKIKNVLKNRHKVCYKCNTKNSFRWNKNPEVNNTWLCQSCHNRRINIGRILPKESIQKSINSRKWYKHSQDTKMRISNTLKNKKKSIEHKLHISLSKMGEKNPNYNRVYSLEEKITIGDKFRQEKSHFWKGGVTQFRKNLRNCFLFVEWRDNVFNRDDYTCLNCGLRGNGVYLHAHHIKPFSDILNEYNITTLDKAIACNQLWDIDNGVTLCKKCHTLTFDWFK